MANKTEYTLRWRKRHPEQHRAYMRGYNLRKYGITLEQYEEMLEQQGGVCAVCRGTNPSGHRLAVDHCHKTSRVRGLLCHACNAGIGKLRDDPALLLAAHSYLTKE